MEHSDRNQRSYGQNMYGEQNRAQIPRMYAMNAARFRIPQLPHQHAGTTAPSTSFSGHSFLDHEHYVAGSIPSGFHYPSHSAVEGSEQMGYGAHHQQTSMSYGPANYVYESQPTQTDQYYQSSSVRTMSLSSSHLDVPQTPQLYSQPHQSQSSSSGSGSLENVSLSQHSTYQTPNMPYGNYQAYSHQQQYATQNNPAANNESFEQYQTRTKEIFTLVKNRQLAPTADVLIQISQYLLGSVSVLGLDRDDKSQHTERLKLWDTFNQCWLTTLQAQLRMTRSMQRNGTRLAPSQSILEAEDLETLGQNLVRLCDGVENIGLVDYQMGVAEEEIVELLIKCLDVVKPTSADTSTGSGSATRR